MCLQSASNFVAVSSIVVKIIKETLGSVASGTPCTIYYIIIAVNLLHVSVTFYGHLQGKCFFSEQIQPNQ